MLIINGISPGAALGDQRLRTPWAPEGVILGSPLSTAVPLGLQENAMKIDSECATAPGFGFPGQGLLWGWG